MAKDIQKAFGKRVRELRGKRKWSQERMAEASGMHWTYIGQVERGERNLTLKSINAIARALGVSMSELLKGVE